MPATVHALDAPVATLGECPVWCPEEAVLYWVDIEGQVVLRHDPGSGETQTRKIDGRPGSIALTTVAGHLVVASEHRLLLLDWEADRAEVLVDLETAGTGNRLNDGRCDPAGRFVVGSMYADTNAGRTTGTLHRIDQAGTTETLRNNVGVSNGLAFDAERGRMYFADTPTEQVLAFDYDAETGAVTNERVFFDYADHPGKPDGACVDADGCYWSASVYGWSLLRITPDGVVDRRVEVPVEKPSMPCFGGPGLDTLFVSTIGAAGTKPSAPGRDGFVPGATLAIEGLGVTGVAEPRFATHNERNPNDRS